MLKICISPGSGDRTGYRLITLYQAFAIWNLFLRIGTDLFSIWVNVIRSGVLQACVQLRAWAANCQDSRPGQSGLCGPTLGPNWNEVLKPGFDPLKNNSTRLSQFFCDVCCFKSPVTLKFNLVSAPNFAFRCGLSKADHHYTLSLTLLRLSCKRVWYEKNCRKVTWSQPQLCGGC